MSDLEPSKNIEHVVEEEESSIDIKTSNVIASVDPVLTEKLILAQKAFDDIGMTRFHWKLFCLNGFGYAADSLLVVCESISQPQVKMQFGRTGELIPGVSTASAVGLLIGALFWGLGADIIGRRLAFNSSLFISAIFVIIAGAMPGYISFNAMVTIYSAGSGGNYILDATNLLEFLPRSHAFLTTILAVWWGVGYTITGLLAWAFMSNFSCLSEDNCTNKNNSGWRYLHYTAGSIVLVTAILRVTIIRLPQSPKWLLTQGEDEKVYETLSDLSIKYKRPISLTLQDLTDLGKISNQEKARSFKAFRRHVSDLFSSRQLAWSTILLFLLWILIGLGDPLYAVFRPYYLKTRGFKDEEVASNYIIWRNYAIGNVCALVGPLFAWPLLDTPYIRRRGTLAIGAFATMAFLFGYTQVKTPTQNMALSFVISAVEYIFFGALYGVTPELLPTGSRGTGYGLAVAINRVCNVMANVIAGYANVQTVAPLFICAAMFGGMAIVSLALPFEPSGRYGG